MLLYRFRLWALPPADLPTENYTAVVNLCRLYSRVINPFLYFAGRICHSKLRLFRHHLQKHTRATGMFLWRIIDSDASGETQC